MNNVKEIDYLFKNPNGIHGVRHSINVLKLVIKLEIKLQLDNEQSDILEFCALYHDIGRDNDGKDNYHGFKSYSKIQKFGLLPNDININAIKFIIEYHSIDDEIALDELKNDKDDYIKKLYFAFKDADGLDRMRFKSDKFDERYLRFKESADLIQYAKEINRR